MDQEERAQQVYTPLRLTGRQLQWAGVAVGLLTIAILIGYLFGITLWDWIKLLIVPAVIAGGGIWFNRQQRERELEIATQQRDQELEIAERRTQDEALQAYLDQMSNMLIPTNEQPSLYEAQPDDSLSSVARARTLTVLPRLDGHRKAYVVQFLYESGLISGAHPVLDLRGADLREVRLTGSYMYETDLSGVNLSGAVLERAWLSGVILRNAYLEGARLQRAALSFTPLKGAHLEGALLEGAHLNNAFLSGANLYRASLNGNDPTKPGANLQGAEGITNEELERQATYLEGAIMPNGQQYEEWLKDREGRREDVENE